jgi:hypothetical protein
MDKIVVSVKAKSRVRRSSHNRVLSRGWASSPRFGATNGPAWPRARKVLLAPRNKKAFMSCALSRRDLSPNFPPLRSRVRGYLSRSPSLGHPKIEFSRSFRQRAGSAAGGHQGCKRQFANRPMQPVDVYVDHFSRCAKPPPFRSRRQASGSRSKTIVHDLEIGKFLNQQRNVVLVRGAGKTHLVIGMARTLIRNGRRG